VSDGGSSVATPLVTALLGFLSGYGAFELQEWRRRRRHSTTLEAALRGERARSERVLATYVYLWDPVAEPTATGIAEFRRLCAETGLWGDDNPQTAEGGQFSDEELASRLR
jgi:hypothetical protein